MKEHLNRYAEVLANLPEIALVDLDYSKVEYSMNVYYSTVKLAENQQ